MMSRCIRHLLEYFAVRVVLSLIQAVDLTTSVAVCRWLAWLAADILRIRDRVVQDNLRIAFPEMSDAERRQVTRRMWEHLLVMVCEAALVQRKIHYTNWRSYVRVENKRAWIRAVG